MNRQGLSRAFLSVFILLVGSVAGRATAIDPIVWKSTAASDTFETGTNWSGDVAPTSSSTGTDLQFSDWTTWSENAYVTLNASFEAHALIFSGDYPHYYLRSSSPEAYTLRLGAGGIFADSGVSQNYVDLSYGLPIVLLADQTWTVHGNLSVYGNISDGAGSYSLTKVGAGALTLGGVNTFQGGLSIEAGTLTLASSSDNSEGIEGPVGRGTLKLAVDTTLDTTGDTTLHNAIDLGLFEGTVTLDTGCDDLSLLGTISGAASLRKRGHGTLTLSGANTFTGDFTVSRGTLLLGHSSTVDGQGLITSSPVGTGTLTLKDSTTLGVAAEAAVTLHNDIDLACFNGSGVTFDTGAGSLTLLGSISGSSTLTKIGSGTLTLAGDSYFDAGLTVEAGTLLLGRSSTIREISSFMEGGDGYYSVESGPVGTGTLKLETGTTLGVTTGASITLHNEIDLGCFSGTVTIDTGTGDLTLLGLVTGAAGIDKQGSGTLTLDNGDNDFEGGVSVHGGTLLVTSSTHGSDGYVGPLGNQYGGLKLYDGTTFGVADGNDVLLFTDIDLDCRAETNVTIDTGTGSLRLFGDITGDASLTKTGSGTLVLGSSYYDDDENYDFFSYNTFTGGLILQQGTLLLASGYNTESSSGPVGTGTLTLRNGTTLGMIGNNGSISLWNDIALDTTPGTATIDVGTEQELNLNGGISGTAGITKTGAGVLELGGENSYTGPTNVNAGTLRAGSGDAFSSLTAVTVASGATLDLSSHPFTFGSLAGAGDVTNGGILTVGTDNTSTTFSGTIAGSSLTKVGTGALTLTGTNTYTDATTISGGLLAINSDSSLGTAPVSATPGHLVIDGGVLRSIASLTLNANRGLSLGTNGGTLSPDAATTLTYAGIIAGSGKLTKTGSGTLNLGGANTYTGGTLIKDGSLVLGANNSLPTGGNVALVSSTLTSELHLNGTTQSIGALDLGGLQAAISANHRVFLEGGTLTLGGNVTFDATNNPGSNFIGGGTGTLNLGVATRTFDIGDTTAATDLTIDSTIAGSGVGIVKAGAGTLLLSGSNTYTGGTTINAGTLVAGSATAFGTGSVTVNGGQLGVAHGVTFTNSLGFGANGGTLGGTGTFAGPLTLGNGVILSPGNSPGTLTFTGSVTFNPGARYDWQIQSATGTAGTDWDLISISSTPGTLDLTSLSTPGSYTLKVISLNTLGVAGQLNGIVPFSNNQWTILTTTGGILGATNLANFTLDTSGFTSDVGGTFSLTASGNDLVLNFAAIPEPSTYALLGLGLSLTGLAAWRKKHRA